jgi:hypothetical protein
LSDLGAAKWARKIFSQPFLEASGVKVMTFIAWERRHAVFVLELYEANNALVQRIELGRRKLAFEQVPQHFLRPCRSYGSRLVLSVSLEAWQAWAVYFYQFVCEHEGNTC